MPGGDWNSFKTIGEETGRFRQPATWVEYFGTLLLWPIALPWAVHSTMVFLASRNAIRLRPALVSPLLPHALWEVWYPLLMGIGFIVGIGICARMYLERIRERRLRAVREPAAAGNHARSIDESQSCPENESPPLTGTPKPD
jgi:hypothetical protein